MHAEVKLQYGLGMLYSRLGDGLQSGVERPRGGANWWRGDEARVLGQATYTCMGVVKEANG